ncbi:MAG: B12-binding domain-containing protein [Candidatus Nanopelagicales bacterium]
MDKPTNRHACHAGAPSDRTGKWVVMDSAARGCVQATKGEISLEEAAQRLGVHYMTAYRYIRMGKLVATKSGAEWRVTEAALREFAAAGRSAPRGRGAIGRDYAGQLRHALLSGDEPTAWQIVSDALSTAHNLETLYSDVLAATMRRIGWMWQCGELQVAQEHLATAAMSRMLGRLSPLSRRRGPTRGTVVLACVPGDTHALATSLAADPIRNRGFSVFDLGGDTPVSSLRHVCQQHEVLAIGLFAATTAHCEQLAGVTAELRTEIDVPILLGGAAVSDNDPLLEGTTLISSTSQALDWLESTAAPGANRRTPAG